MSIFVIAEIGINHNGDVEIAKKLIDVAKDAGADAVKFQKRTIDLVYTKEMLDSPRQSPWGTTQRAQKEGLEFGMKEYNKINTYCKEKGIKWFASAWDLESKKFLRQYDCKYNKIASAMIVYEDLLKEVASDQAASVEPAGFRQLIGAVRKIEKAMGDGNMAVNPKEISIAKKLRAHIPFVSNR